MRGLEGRGVLVSGGTRGIGLAAAERFAAEGAHVFVTGHDAAELEAVLAAHGAVGGTGGTGGAVSDPVGGPAGDSLGGFVGGQVCDVADAAQVASAVAAAEKATGGLSILANNAGISQRDAFLDIEVEVWDRILEVNLRGMFLMGQAVARLLRDTGRTGSIVNMASTNGFGGEEDYAHYNASKGGVIQLTRSMAVELGELGIRVNALCPGYIDTPLNLSIASGLDAGFAERYARERIPLRRVGTPEEVAAAYAFLASDEASFIHGATLVIDGGQLAVM